MMHIAPITLKLPTVFVLLLLTQVLVSCGGSSGGSGGSTGSPAPGSDYEPIAEDATFNTAVGFNVVREPGARLPVAETDPEITEAEFALGLPEPVVQVPDGVDTSTNTAPFFENLQNLTVNAGDIVEVVYLPRDSEGELPGMFPEKLPQGSSFDDNFDGSKTFRWQPLQMDVGILKFTVTALDPANSRVFLRFSDELGEVRGATSVAVEN